MVDKEKKTYDLLWKAIDMFDLETVKVIFLFGTIDPNVCKESEFGSFPVLHYALQRNQCQIAHYLLDRGANMHIQDSRSGFSAIHYTVEKPCLSSVTERLIELKADVNQKARNGTSALFWSLWAENNSANVESLLGAGAELFEENKRFPKMTGTWNAYEKVSKWLSSRGN